MINVKGIAIASDGNMKRIAITYDEIDENGKIINPNKKLSRIVTDQSILEAVSKLELFAESAVNS